MPERAKEKNMRKQFFSFFLVLCQKKEGKGGLDYGHESPFGRNDLTDSKPFEGEMKFRSRLVSNAHAGRF